MNVLPDVVGVSRVSLGDVGLADAVVRRDQKSPKRKRQHKIIFIGGIHGVGKTTLCTSLSLKFNIQHYSSSDLISRIKQVELSSKRTNKIIENQDALVTAINEYTISDNYFLLDGHFCLLDEMDNIVRIPSSTYIEMSPAAIILLHDDPQAVYCRLKARDKEKIALLQLKALQGEEIAYSEEVATELTIPYILSNPFTEEDTVVAFVSNILAQGMDK